MFGLFKKKSEVEKLQQQYAKLQKEAFILSKTDRAASDAMVGKAEKVMQEIERLREKN